MKPVIVLGDINIDVLMPIAVYPPPGGEAVSEGISMQAGGSAANAATVLARLGLPVQMIGRCGQDAWGDLALRALNTSGVETDLVQRDLQATTGVMFTVILPDGERTMFGQRGANILTDPADIPEQRLVGTPLVLLSGYALLQAPQRLAAWRLVEIARRLRIPIALDSAYLPVLTAADSVRDLLPHLDICVIGRQEALALTGAATPDKAANGLIALGVRMVGIKQGSEGCLVVDKNGAFRIPAFQVRVLDATGAGDAFTAGLIFAFLHGASLPACGVLANTLGALATTRLGAGSMLPGKAEALELLQQAHPDPGNLEKGWISEALELLCK